MRTARSPILSRACITANKVDRGLVGSSIHSRNTPYTVFITPPLGGCCCIADVTPPALKAPPVAASLPTSSGVSSWVSRGPSVRRICGFKVPQDLSLTWAARAARAAWIYPGSEMHLICVPGAGKSLEGWTLNGSTTLDPPPCLTMMRLAHHPLLCF